MTLFTPLISAGIERLLNTLLYQDQALKAARQRVCGKVLQLSVREFATPWLLVFSEQHVDVLNQWQGGIDASVSSRLTVLFTLREGTQISALIRRNELDVQGDIQLVQDVMTLLNLAHGDLAHWLAYALGDVGGQAASQCLSAGAGWLKRGAAAARQNLAQVVTEEWRLAPGSLEVSWFADEVAVLAGDVDQLTGRLDKLEGK